MSLNSLDSMRQDWNKSLNQARTKLNREIRQQCMEILERRKNSGVEADGPKQ